MRRGWCVHAHCSPHTHRYTHTHCRRHRRHQPRSAFTTGTPHRRRRPTTPHRRHPHSSLLERAPCALCDAAGEYMRALHTSHMLNAHAHRSTARIQLTYAHQAAHFRGNLAREEVRRRVSLVPPTYQPRAEVMVQAAGHAGTFTRKEGMAGVIVKEATVMPHGQSAPARLLCLPTARLTAPGSSSLPGRGRPTGNPATASGARASRLQDRRFHRR